MISSPRASGACGWLRVALGLAAVTIAAHAQVAIVSNYSENFDNLGTALPAGWGVWTSSTSTGNGTAFTWNTTTIANNESYSSFTAFRNLPGASQTWSAGLSSGSDRALGWRAGSAGTRDGSITFTLSNTTGYNLTSMSFNVFTPNSSGTTATFDFQYQIGSSGTFTSFSPATTYTTVSTSSGLTITTITLTSSQLAVVSNQSSQVTFRFDNTATSGTSWNTLAIDNFSYSASAIPEPGTYAAILGALAFGYAAWRRRT